MKRKDKVAVITGGTSSLGLATAHRFIAEGAYVCIELFVDGGTAQI